MEQRHSRSSAHRIPGGRSRSSPCGRRSCTRRTAWISCFMWHYLKSYNVRASRQMPKRAKVVRGRGYLNERAFQRRVKAGLDQLYPEVTIQWRPFQGQGRHIYAPAVDIAVGPFAIEQRYIAEYDALIDRTRGFIQTLIDRHNDNCAEYAERAQFEDIRTFNANARCFLCIEIEESGGRKHCLGNLVNASALGRVGILVARNPSVLRVFLRQRAYLHFLAQVQKNTFITTNALVLTAEQLTECLPEIRPPANGI